MLAFVQCVPSSYLGVPGLTRKPCWTTSDQRTSTDGTWLARQWRARSSPEEGSAASRHATRPSCAPRKSWCKHAACAAQPTYFGGHAPASLLIIFCRGQRGGHARTERSGRRCQVQTWQEGMCQAWHKRVLKATRATEHHLIMTNDDAQVTNTSDTTHEQ